MAELATVTLELVRNVIDGSSEFGVAVAAEWPFLETASAGMAAALPVPSTVAPFAAPPFFRPAGSLRCFYYGPLGEPGAGGPMLAIKGIEPCIGDFDALLRELRRACYSPHSMAEHLVFEERKIPACLGLGEALHEADCALAIQRAHLRRYGALARLPVPLFVFRHSEATSARIREDLRQLLSPAAFAAVQPALEAGLGVYVYCYPGNPIRVRDLDHLLQGLGFRERLIALLRDVCDPEDIIQRWVQTFARMLHLGFVPGSLAALHTGICCQPQNACLDGGFVDLGSLTPMSGLDDTALQAALQFSTESLVQTVRTLVAGGADPARAETRDVRIDLHHLSDYVFAMLRTALAAEARPGHALDARVASYFTPAASFADLVDRLRTYYTAPSEFDRAACDVSGFVYNLLSSQKGR